MRKLTTFLGIGTLAMLVYLFFNQHAHAFQRETRDLPPFTKISLSVTADVYLTQGNIQKVDVEGDEEDLEELVMEVVGNKLIIKSKSHGRIFGSWSSWDDVNIYITLPTIEGISVAGSGSVTGRTKISTDDLDLSISGSGNIELDIKAEEIDADITGSGDMDLKVQTHQLSCHITGSGDIEVAGTGKSIALKITGSGDIDASGFEAEECIATITGSGSCEVYATKRIDANISGSGDIRYKGNPDHVNSRTSGSGHAVKM